MPNNFDMSSRMTSVWPSLSSWETDVVKDRVNCVTGSISDEAVLTSSNQTVYVMCFNCIEDTTFQRSYMYLYAVHYFCISLYNFKKQKSVLPKFHYKTVSIELNGTVMQNNFFLYLL